MTRFALKRLVTVAAGQSPPSSEVAPFDDDGLPFLQGNAEFGDEHPSPAYRCDSAPRVCRAGDILMSVRAPVGALNIAERTYGIGRGLCAITGRAINHRFLWWLLYAYRDILHSLAVGSTYDAVTTEDVESLQVDVPSQEAQRAIADYLDAETVRIDALIEKKQRMLTLLEERFQRLIDDVVWSGVDQAVPLKRRVQWNRPIMYGIVLPGPDVPDGVPIVKGGDVAARRLSPDRLARTTYEIEAPYARARLHARDLVFAIRGGVGDVELVPPELEGANITQDVARVAPAADVDPKWLQLVLRSAEVRQQVEQRVTGATIKGLNIWDLKRVCVPSSDGQRQRADVARLSAEEGRVCLLVDALGSQSSLLAEHRQALITAAVIGELGVPRMVA